MNARRFKNTLIGTKLFESNENAFNVMNLEEFLEENNIQVLTSNKQGSVIVTSPLLSG